MILFKKKKPSNLHNLINSSLSQEVIKAINAEARSRAKIESANLQQFAAHYFRLGAEWALTQSKLPARD